MTPDIVRAWAKEQGIPVGVRGRVPHNITEAYILAHQLAPSGNIVDALKPLPKYTSIASTPPKPRKPRAPKQAPDIRAEAVRGPEATTLITGAPMRVIGEQGNWRFLALVVQPGGKVYVDCVDPGGVGRAIDPSKLALAHKSVTAADVRPKLAEREASATAHARRRGK